MLADDYALARKNMVANQILPNKVNQPSLVSVLSTIPRHMFVSDDFQPVAYTDRHIPLKENRYLVSPMVFSQMLQASEVQPEHSVLVIGCGTGYSSAIFSKLATKVVAIENDNELTSKASMILNNLNITNVITVEDNLSNGHAEGESYNVIFIDGGVRAVPETFKTQLANNGKIIALVRETPATGCIITIERQSDGSFVETELSDAVAPLLPGFENE